MESPYSIDFATPAAKESPDGMVMSADESPDTMDLSAPAEDSPSTMDFATPEKRFSPTTVVWDIDICQFAAQSPPPSTDLVRRLSSSTKVPTSSAARHTSAEHAKEVRRAAEQQRTLLKELYQDAARARREQLLQGREARAKFAEERVEAAAARRESIVLERKLVASKKCAPPPQQPQEQQQHSYTPYLADDNEGGMREELRATVCTVLLGGALALGMHVAQSAAPALEPESLPIVQPSGFHQHGSRLIDWLSSLSVAGAAASLTAAIESSPTALAVINSDVGVYALKAAASFGVGAGVGQMAGAALRAKNSKHALISSASALTFGVFVIAFGIGGGAGVGLGQMIDAAFGP